MVGRWFIVAVVGLAVFTYANRADDTRAVAANVQQSCSATVPGATTVTFTWGAPGAGAQQTWFDISLSPGFLPGWFTGHGPLAATQTAYAFDGVPQGLRFYYRVNTFYGNVWRETASGTFVTGCGAGAPARAPVTAGVTQQCDGAGNVTVTFSWQANAGGSQWLDLSTMNNGFAPGTFVGAGPVPSGGASFTWRGIARNLVHYWRVNALTASGWLSSDTGAFASLTCLPPMKACVGYMAGYTPTGRAECEQIVAGPDKDRAGCIAHIIGAGGNRDACLHVGGEKYLNDCLLGLTGRSHFGRTSCRIYYGS
jgi:hypothetical protein